MLKLSEYHIVALRTMTALGNFILLYCTVIYTFFTLHKLCILVGLEKYNDNAVSYR